MTTQAEPFYRLCGAALLAVLATAVLSELSKTLGTSVRLSGRLLLYGGILVLAAPILAKITAFAEGYVSGELAELLCKSLGIALIAEIVSGICRDLGDGGLSVLVETAGKLVILGMALPVQIGRAHV